MCTQINRKHNLFISFTLLPLCRILKSSKITAYARVGKMNTENTYSAVFDVEEFYFKK